MGGLGMGCEWLAAQVSFWDLCTYILGPEGLGGLGLHGL